VPRDEQRALALPAHAQLQGTQPADAEPGLVRGEVRAVELDPVGQLQAQLLAAGDGAAHDIAVAVQVLRERVHDDVSAARRGTEQDRRREGRIDGDRRAGRAGRGRDGGDIDDAQQRVRDGLDEHERTPGHGPRDRRGIRRIDKADVATVLRSQPFRERARTAVAVLLDHQGSAMCGEQRVHGRHPAREARRPRELVELREEHLECRCRGRPVAAVDVSMLLAREDRVLIGERRVVESDALDERRHDGSPRARRQRAPAAHYLRADPPRHRRQYAPH